MKTKIDLQLLQDTIVDLKNNPNACTTIGGETAMNGSFTIAESKPGEKLSIFIQYLYENNLLDNQYLANSEKIVNKEIDNMTYEEVFTKITWILRGDRFNSGFIYSCFKEGMLLKLLERLEVLLK